ncbi:hypothetical protein, partial [Paenibacillus eucommiae]|uniref:hypothetical protein n=1 Tax=Paenibacillus eucommiae TaxID=1355755 RepID=UPI001AE334B7
TSKNTHLKEHAPQRTRTSKNTHLKEHAPQRTRTSKNTHLKEHPAQRTPNAFLFRKNSLEQLAYTELNLALVRSDVSDNICNVFIFKYFKYMGIAI